MNVVNTSKKKLLILSDRFSTRDRLINLGDRAKLEGLHHLIEKNLEYQLVSGCWKSFPYFNIRRFKKKSSQEDIERIFNEWFDQITSFSHRIVKFETWVLSFLDNSFLFNNRIFRKIDKKVQDKFSMGLIEALKPYILRNYYSYRLVSQIKSADIVVSNAHFLADHLIFYLPLGMFEVFLAKKLGKKVITVNQTVSVTGPLAFSITSFVYKMVDMHITRDPISKNVLIKMGVDDDRIVVSADSAFAIDISDGKDVKSLIEKEGIQKGSVAVIIRGDRDVHYESWMKVISHIQEKYGREVFYLFTCKSHDEHVFKKLAKICRLHKLSKYYDYPILIQIMRNFDFVITDRYHGAIFAILSNTPVIPVDAQTFKTKGLFMQFDYPIEVLNTLSVNSYDSMVESIERVVKNQREIKDKLSKTRTYLVNMVNENFKAIS